jgi:hypothetical protein
MLKNFLMRSLIKSKLKGVPEAQQEQILNMVEQHPELFTEIGKKVEAKMKQGTPQMQAVMSVLQEYKGQLSSLMQK